MDSLKPIPVLWLCGPSGVGKTSAGWELFTKLTRSGSQAAYADIDQLGMCFPERPADLGRHRLKAANLNAVIATFRCTGAECVIVSGVVDPGHGVHTDLIHDVDLTVVRLRTTRAELRHRYLHRNSMTELLDQTLADADALEATDFADLCMDTTDLDAAAVATRIGTHWPGKYEPTETPLPGPSTEGGPILWLCGPTGVGKSTVGFTVYQALMRSGLTTAYIDLDQLGFRTPTPTGNHAVKAANLAALWHTYRAAGAQYLVMSGPAPDKTAIRHYTDALPKATITVCRLHASPDDLTQRILSRAHGGSWPQPGDPLKGKSPEHLRQIAAQAADDMAVGDLWVDTTGRTVEDIAETIVTNTAR